MGAPHTDAGLDIADAVRRIASEARMPDVAARLGEVWREVAGGAIGLVFVARGTHGWSLAGVSPAEVTCGPDAGAVLSEALAGGDVRSVDAIVGELGITWSGGSVDGGVGVRIAPANCPEHLLVAVGTAPNGMPDPATTRAVATVAALVLERAAAREHLDLERARSDSLVSAGLVLSAELNLDDVLQRVVDAAREVLCARYAALGVLDPERPGLSNFVTSGLTAQERAAIGDLPRGRGLLGLLITDARPVCVESIPDDPRSTGFPPGHPPMTTFLGVPIRVGAKVFGNLYITDKLDGPFLPEDELVALTLAAQAAVAIGNAQRYSEQEQTALIASQERERATAEGLRRAIEAQEAERARIARELHDEAGQELTALALQLLAMDDHISGAPGRAHLAAMRQALARTSTNLRALAVELRPSGLREHGLASAIERQAARLQDSSGIAIDVAVGAIPDRLGDAIEIALFRVVQESLTNVARHSGADRASVVASLRGGQLRVVIEDNGAGFDPDASTDRLGLAGIRERIQLIGGGLRIESSPGSGTTVIIDLEVPHV